MSASHQRHPLKASMGHGHRSGWILLLLFAMTAAACAPKQDLVNPTFAVTVEAAKADLRRMETSPVTLSRPVVVIGGWADPLGRPPQWLAQRLREVTGDDRILAIGMGGILDFDAARERVVAEVSRHFGWNGEDTVRVDVVGFSMGGLVARHAAIEEAAGIGGSGRLRIARLFTISTPHRGATLAALPVATALGREMRAGSDLLASLDEARDAAESAAEEEAESYPIIAYVRLDDLIVGEENAAPGGSGVWWVPSLPLQISHAHAYRDPRIIADIARRLRNESPLTTHPPAPLPDEQSQDIPPSRPNP